MYIGGDGRFIKDVTIAVDTIFTIPANKDRGVIAVLPQSGQAFPGEQRFVYNWAIGSQYKYPARPARLRNDGIPVMIEVNANRTDKYDLYVSSPSPFFQTSMPEDAGARCDAGMAKCPCIAN